MKLLAYLASIFDPSEMEGLRTDELIGALADSGIRKHWIWSVMEEMKEIHKRTHGSLIKGNFSEEFVKESSRLQALEWSLRQILNSKTSVELDRRHNPSGAASLDSID